MAICPSSADFAKPLITLFRTSRQLQRKKKERNKEKRIIVRCQAKVGKDHYLTSSPNGTVQRLHSSF
jgi:hypothetical protein